MNWEAGLEKVGAFCLQTSWHEQQATLPGRVYVHTHIHKNWHTIPEWKLVNWVIWSRGPIQGTFLQPVTRQDLGWLRTEQPDAVISPDSHLSSFASVSMGHLMLGQDVLRQHSRSPRVNWGGAEQASGEAMTWREARADFNHLKGCLMEGDDGHKWADWVWHKKCFQKTELPILMCLGCITKQRAPWHS